ncbi:MAG TPA: SCP2 sterol-binding domain-containing protein [Candidatus Lokiarchaeia archaeon]|nr:SCP2 sterol-binding domain-containing protein [Candidatus Lokiarchaeia archaeon]
MSEIVSELKAKIEDGSLAGEDLPSVLDAIVEIVNNNKDSQELMADMAEEGDEVKINFIIPEVGDRCLAIIGGQASHLPSQEPDATVTISTDADTAVAILSGKLDAFAAFGDKKLSLEGNLAKATALILLLQVVGDTLGIEFKR